MASKNGSPDCVIGSGSIFEGRFYVSGSIHIEGKFQGDIRTDDELVVGPTGQVKTDITARRVKVAGTLIGNITASEEVYLVQSGKVLGNITTPKLSVESGVITSGKVIITSEDSENVADIVNKSFGDDADEAFKSNSKRIQKESSAKSS